MSSANDELVRFGQLESSDGDLWFGALIMGLAFAITYGIFYYLKHYSGVQWWERFESHSDREKTIGVMIIAIPVMGVVLFFQSLFG